MKMDGVFFRDEEKEVFRIQHIDLLKERLGTGK
jgi:hypothetical protein